MPERWRLNLDDARTEKDAQERDVVQFHRLMNTMKGCEPAGRISEEFVAPARKPEPGR